MRILVTGGCGFIGSALVRRLVAEGHDVLNLDALTYAGDERSVAAVAGLPNYQFRRGDVADADIVGAAMSGFNPDRIFHLAAESHVDRSIDGPGIFVTTNLVGTSIMLDAALMHWRGLDEMARAAFRFIHVSTDEVYGTLGFGDPAFAEDTPYAPNSPYAASKAGADHLARAWVETYGLPVIITNCSNNYGPYQHPEKLIPTVIRTALSGGDIPVYGKGENIRDWLYVADHVAGLMVAADSGEIGRKYNFGGDAERTNIDLVRTLCRLLDEKRPAANAYEDQIRFVADRPGHDLRYAVDSQRAQSELGWAPSVTLDKGLSETVDWYLANPDWLSRDPAEIARLGLGR
ncbi:dTDP-glucose 4,6-dehydratase [Hyphobacterium sp. CCMP332]|uniref:dTDP-glucose 4,6-dehydratase n=1 Tax=Hyphobacterium sp. CCMP332 TaxID=2749086 RepID=UPI00164F76B0|nr:dTDP-glucose 4,6-dehydratase [Hyphobacterium sp. CCMP332]QNL19398.1 dTDP-glucose 4,6-dehydratase [Hyphobacterium sp. CCMP332]